MWVGEMERGTYKLAHRSPQVKVSACALNNSHSSLIVVSRAMHKWGCPATGPDCAD